uniref:Uncharacterized protein n=1 Tax=Anguilla anguilla TaxID=7936 RepID=A0A0E9QHF5_ANGAN
MLFGQRNTFTPATVLRSTEAENEHVVSITRHRLSKIYYVRHFKCHTT